MINNRQILLVTGSDCEDFLQQILTNNVKILVNELQYNLILTAQGKLLHDLLIAKLSENCFMLDCYSRAADDIISLFKKYKLGSDVNFVVDHKKYVYWSDKPLEKSYKDPRQDLFSYRFYSDEKLTCEIHTMDQEYYELSLPQLYIDFAPGKYFPFEVGFDRFNSISYDKGCYIGQEVITRTHFRGMVRKKVYKVRICGIAARDDEIYTGDRKVGVILGIYGGGQYDTKALAMLNQDLLKEGTLTVNGIVCEVLQ